MATTTTATATSLPLQTTQDEALTLRQRLDRDGFVVIPSALTPEQLTSLRALSQNITDIARKGGWPYIRTLPKQFPPWGTSVENGIWGVQHLMHPDMPGREAFTASYFTDSIVDTVRALLEGAQDEDLILELYNLLIRPDHDFELRWHRDDIGPDATAEQELERLNKPGWHAQWNLALYDDSSLIVVPGTHARARTEAERAADPFEQNMPGQMIVHMKAGDAVFYNNNILHRGAYKSTIERMTLHGSIGHVKGSAQRARNVLQHGVGQWIEQVDFAALPEDLRKRAETMRGNLMAMGREAGDVGYAQPD